MPIDRPDDLDREGDGEDRSVLDLPAAAPTSTWQYGADRDQVSDVFLPDVSAGPILALVHGGFWRPEYDRSHLRPLASALRDLGHPVVNLEYRREPGDPDRGLADLRAALDQLAHEPPPGCPAGPPIVIGHSAGGHLALLLAADRPARVIGCVALAPVADLTLANDLELDAGAVRAFLGSPAADRADLDPAAGPGPAVPTTILHGSTDSLVPLALSVSYVASAGGRARLVALADTGHFELIDPRSNAFAELLGAVDRTGIE
jgi:acetyl esterase/lipase